MDLEHPTQSSENHRAATSTTRRSPSVVTCFQDMRRRRKTPGLSAMRCGSLVLLALAAFLSDGAGSTGSSREMVDQEEAEEQPAFRAEELLLLEEDMQPMARYSTRSVFAAIANSQSEERGKFSSKICKIYRYIFFSTDTKLLMFQTVN